MADKSLYKLLIDLGADTAQLTRDMDKAVGILQRSGSLMRKTMEGVFQGIGQAIGTDLIRNVEKLSGALGHLADRGEDVSGVADNFKKLGGSADVLKKAQDSLLGTASAFDLMKAANAGLARGIPEFNKNFATMSEFAGRFADAKGEDAVEVLNRLVQAVGSGSQKALAEFGIQVSEGADKTTKMKEAISQLLPGLERFAPLTDSVSNAHKAFSVAIQDALDLVGQGINENTELTEAYRKLAEEVVKVNWKQVGSDVAVIASNFATLTTQLVTMISPLTEVLKYMTQVSVMAREAENWGLQTQKLALQAQQALNVRTPQQMIADNTGIDFLGSASKREQWVQKETEIQSKITELNKKIRANDVENLFALNAKTVDKGTPYGPNIPNGMMFDQIKKQWVNVADVFSESLNKTGTASNTKVTADRLKKETETQEKIAQRTSEESAKQIEEEQRQQEQAYQQSIDTWSSLFSTAINGGTQDLESLLKQVAVDFAAQMAQSIFGNIGGGAGGAGGGSGSIGGAIAQMLGNALGFSGGASGGMTTTQAHAAGVQGPGMADGSFGGAAVGSAAGSFAGSFMGSGMTGAEANAAGIEGPAMADGSFGGSSSGGGGGMGSAMGYVAAAQLLISSTMSASDRNKQTRSEEGTGAAAGTAIGAAIGTAIAPGIGTVIGAYIGNFGGGKIGGLFGHGAQNPESRARHLIANYLEDALKDSKISFARQDGSRYMFDGNIKEGSSSKFNKEGWAEDFKKQAGTAMSTFTSLGEVLEELSGATEDVGGQFGYILGENLAFNVDNARKLVRKLGLSYEEMEEKIISLGIEQNKTWLETETLLQGAADATGAGLSAVGAWKQGFDNLINSGARGFDAIDSLRTIAVEAKESGISSFEALRQQMIKTYDPKTVDAFFQALSQRGITSFDQLASASDRTAGGVVADMQALGVSFKEVEEGLSGINETLGKLTETLNNLNGTLGGKSLSAPPPEQAFAIGGIVNRPTRALMGEAGPEAIMPLTRVNGKLGVAAMSQIGNSSGYTIHIDARGAEAGVEKKIRSAMRDVEDRTMRRVMRAVAQSSARRT